MTTGYLRDNPTYRPASISTRLTNVTGETIIETRVTATMIRNAQTTAASDRDSAAHRRAWLLLLHQLPSEPTSLRVRTWRRLQQIGALPVKNGAQGLQDPAAAREHFEWLRTEITTAGGQATIFVADTVDQWAHDALVDEFRRSRETEYTALAHAADQLSRRTTTTARASTRRAAAKGSSSSGVGSLRLKKSTSSAAPDATASDCC